MALIDAPSQESGKTLLTEVSILMATGATPNPMTAPASPEEWTKSITAALSGGHPLILIDNVVNVLEDASLAAVITSDSWSQRLLGRNDHMMPNERTGFTYPNLKGWVSENRGRLLMVVLTLARAWHVAGRPAPSCPKMRFGA